MYEIIKALHVISVISWMAGLLYLPRLFVYHSQEGSSAQLNAVFQEMERKLLRYIMNPAMILTIAFGLYLALQIGFDFVWLHIKLTLVVLLVIYHHFLSRCRKNFALGINKYSTKFYRIINEVPTILMIAIVFLVILKPF